MKLMPKLRLWFFIWVRFTLISAFLAIVLAIVLILVAFSKPPEDITSDTMLETENISILLSDLISAGVDPIIAVDVFTNAVRSYSREEDLRLQEEEGYELYWSTIFWDMGDFGGSGFLPVISTGKKPDTEKTFRQEAKELLIKAFQSGSSMQIVKPEYFIVATPVLGESIVYGSIGYGVSMPHVTWKFILQYLSALTTQVLLVFALLTLVPGAVITYMLGYRINILRQAAEGFLEGKFGQIKISPAKDELGILADVIKKLDTSLPALLEDRRQAGILDERNRVARNLHDTIKQDLFSVFLTAETLEKNPKIPDSDRRMVSEIKNGISEALETARSLILTYSSDSFGRKQLESGIKSELEKWEKAGAFSGYAISIEDFIIPGKIAESCYMIAKEAAANSARHSRASFININIFSTGESINLLVTDNGNGLAPGWKAGFGMLLMRQRAVEAGGSFHITSPGGKGVMIEVIFPVESENSGEKGEKETYE